MKCELTLDAKVEMVGDASCVEPGDPAPLGHGPSFVMLRCADGAPLALAVTDDQAREIAKRLFGSDVRVHLVASITASGTVEPDEPDAPRVPAPRPLSEVRPLREVEREHIEHALAVEGNTTKAAKALGIGRATLYRRLHAYSAGRREVTP